MVRPATPSQSAECPNAYAVPAALADAAVAAVAAADATISQSLSSGDWGVTVKADQTPVTDVDVAAEKAIRAVLQHATPHAGFYGEETGRVASLGESDGEAAGTDLLWLVDPIDGTKSFVRGMRYYSTQIALAVGEQLVLGVSNAPAYGEQLRAQLGGGAFLNDQPVTTRQEAQMRSAYLSTGNLTSLARDSQRWQALSGLILDVQRVRGYGDFCHYHQLCCGQADIIIESDVNILDIAALTVAVREAGGVMTDLDGLPVSLNTTSVLAAANSQLHANVLDRFNP